MKSSRRAITLNPGFHEFLSGKGAVPENRRLRYLRQMQRLQNLRSNRNNGDELPVILSRHEVLRIINQLEGTARLIAGIMYGSGLRLQECLRLRIRDLDLALGCLTVGPGRAMKGKGRQTILAEKLRADLQQHLFRVRALYEETLRRGMHGSTIPAEVEKGNPEAAQEWSWFWLFPEQHPGMEGGCNHLSASVIEAEIRQAIRAVGTATGATVHTLRDSFANHLIESGCDLQTVEELLGLSEDRESRQPHTRTLSLKSPLD